MRRLGWIMAGWLALASPLHAEMPEQGLIVTGEGRITTEPDMATLSLGVSTTAATAGAAMQANTAAVADILDRLDQLEIAPTDRQTSRFYLNPMWENQTQPGPAIPRIAGYQAGNTVTVRVRNLAALGPMMDSVIAGGGNEFNGLTFGLQDDSALRTAARQAAVADAMTRAGELADAAGLILGEVQLITDNAGSAPPQMMESFARSAVMEDAVATGEVGVTAYVTMVFAIGPRP